MHNVNGLLKLVEVLLKMMMKIGSDSGRCDPFTGTNKQRVVELIAQALERLADC